MGVVSGRLKPLWQHCSKRLYSLAAVDGKCGAIITGHARAKYFLKLIRKLAPASLHRAAPA
jgi:hypothetical protein